MNELPVVVDISALQSGESRGRGIARYALDWCIALERTDPTLVGAYLLNPALAPPGSLGALVDSSKVTHRSQEIISSSTIFHQLVPFDLSQPAATLLPKLDTDQLASATVYDLIPAHNLAAELIDARDRRRYRTRLELVRALDHLQVLSNAVARDLVALLGVDPQKITNVGCAPQPIFIPSADQSTAAERAQGLFGERGLRQRYVLYQSGSHPRKNNERLIAAWTNLPDEIRTEVQLVISGTFDPLTINHFHHLAGRSTGVSDLLITGYVADHDLVTLVQGAELICFPSLAEGYGLPVAEALACARPVIASAISPLDELLPREQLFDPVDEHAITEAIQQALNTSAMPPARALANWDEVGRESAGVFVSMLAEHTAKNPHRPLRRRRSRIAVVSPLPPADSGVARYSYRFIEALAATQKAEITCFSDGPTKDQVAPTGLDLYRVESLQHVERLTGSFDEVIYVLGNSHHHLGALAMLKRRRGTVMCHDVRLSNLYRHAHGDPGLLPGGLGREIEQMYNAALPPTLGANGNLGEEDLERYGLLMARDAISLCQEFLVTSTSAATLATIDARVGTQDRISALPFAMEPPRTNDPGFSELATQRPTALCEIPLDVWGALPPCNNERYIAHFGIVDPIKQPEHLLRALSALTHYEDLRLAFVGPISDALAEQLIALARELGILARVGFTGPLQPAIYAAWLSRAELAIQLRAKTNGEASAAVGECLATGLATIVTNQGWSGELPAHAVCQLSPTATSSELAGEIDHLLQHPELRNMIGDTAAIYARQHSFDFAARSLLQHIANRR